MHRLLIVDDEATITTQLEERLSRLGYDIVGSASSAEEALEKAREYRPDLILMDIVMPGKMDGIDAAEIITKELDIPVIFLTAYGDERYINRAKQAQALGYIIKPYQVEGLKAAIDIALYNKDLIRELKNTESRWKTFVEHSDQGIILGKATGEIFFWNRGARNIFGYEVEEAVSKPLSFILPENNREGFEKEFIQLFGVDSGSDVGKWKEKIGLRKDWSKFPLEMSITTRKDRNRAIFICIVRDITFRKRHEEGMRTSLKEKDLLLEQIKVQVQNNLEIIYRLLDIQSGILPRGASPTGEMNGQKMLDNITKLNKSFDLAGYPTKIDFTTYIKNLADRLIRSYGLDPGHFRLTIPTQNIYLSLRSAIPCGLILSDLSVSYTHLTLPTN